MEVLHLWVEFAFLDDAVVVGIIGGFINHIIQSHSLREELP
jgi:hypothetical protein